MKPVFKTSDAVITSEKVKRLCSRLIKMAADLERIQIEVELLRDANIAMAKTIKDSKYAATD